MSRIVLAVSRWEFLRFAKVRDLVVGALVFAAMFGGGSMFGEFAARQADDERRIGVAGPLGVLGDEGLEVGRMHFVRTDAAAVDSLLANEELEAALVAHGGADVWDLRVLRDRGWHAQVRAQFTALVTQDRLGSLDVDPNELQRVLTPPAIETSILEDTRRDDGRTDILTAGIALGIMLMGVFVGFSFVFVAITGEKTQRTTELMLSAVTPQQWIDGKILGLTGAVMANLLATAAGYLLWQVVGGLFLDKEIALPGGAHPLDLTLIVLYAVLGFAFWFTFFAMIAATIDDPNSSSRSSFMFLPILFLSAPFVGLDTPDVGWMQVLAVIPGTSPGAMPVRLLRGEPGWIEIAASLLLLAAGAWAFRRAAGRIFGTSMLMTGKEPGLREVLRWMREA